VGSSFAYFGASLSLAIILEPIDAFNVYAGSWAAWPVHMLLFEAGVLVSTGDKLAALGLNALLYGALAAMGLKRIMFPHRKWGQCPACGYDLRGTPGGPCPECGAERATAEPPQARSQDRGVTPEPANRASGRASKGY
jgi:hypothetical protein